jgi:hypothetical protein
MTRRITAVELDAALGRLTPELLAELVAAAPPGFAAYVDQINAATAHSISAHKGSERVELMARTDVDEWLRLGLLDTLIGWIDGRGRTCMHAPDYRRPEPVFGCAWRPGLVVCGQCLHLLDVVGEADRTCDVCGYICGGADAGDPIYVGTVWVGALAYEFGTCGDCPPSALPRE